MIRIRGSEGIIPIPLDQPRHSHRTEDEGRTTNAAVVSLPSSVERAEHAGQMVLEGAVHSKPASPPIKVVFTIPPCRIANTPPGGSSSTPRYGGRGRYGTRVVGR